MKTKVAEAMMFGLPIIGTKEAFTGYEVDRNRIGLCSDDISKYYEFIIEIAHANKDRYLAMSDYSRECFEQKYSLDATVRGLKTILNSNNIKCDGVNRI